ncbi:DeoR/GlpR family DNA-binding transcription regulator [Caenispirillum salinarum]|uniref:DeoR/GlpR family DNA-binding transcription regulator n=1 Tax=Caenispirillum salinarum TaxID=859058 RepID=UPI00384F2837
MSGKLRKDARRDEILAELQISPHVRIADLAEKFDVTTETIRRDLDALSELGLVSRAYGGASVRPMGVQPSHHERGSEFVEERARIGAAAAGLVAPGEVVMIDAGSTTLQLARHLGNGDLGLTVVTNCHPVASELGKRHPRIVVCPGEFDEREASVFGTDTVDFLRRFHANKAFIGASGLAADGFCDVNRGAAWVKRTMLERAEEAWLLVDHSKFGLRLLEIVAPLDALTGVVVDQAPDGALAAALQRLGIKVVVAEAAVQPAST